MFGKNLIFYFVSSSIIAAVTQFLGADLFLVLFALLLGPSVILLAVGVMRYNRWI